MFWIIKTIKHLIFRANLYANERTPAALGGLANERTMCQRNACLIIEDGFVSGGWTAAHELGHS